MHELSASYTTDEQRALHGDAATQGAGGGAGGITYF
jgi:hypothetical protein